MSMGQAEQALARKGRVVALVIAGAMVLWIAAQWLAPVVGLPGRFAFLFDFAAMAALIWAMVNIYQIWRARQTGDQADER